jgi:hypothetical protein
MAGFASALQETLIQCSVPELVRRTLVRQALMLEGKLIQRDAEIARLRSELESGRDKAKTPPP